MNIYSNLELLCRNPAHADVFVSASGDCSVKVRAVHATLLKLYLADSELQYISATWGISFGGTENQEGWTLWVCWCSVACTLTDICQTWTRCWVLESPLFNKNLHLPCTGVGHAAAAADAESVGACVRDTVGGLVQVQRLRAGDRIGRQVHKAVGRPRAAARAHHSPRAHVSHQTLSS